MTLRYLLNHEEPHRGNLMDYRGTPSIAPNRISALFKRGQFPGTSSSRLGTHLENSRATYIEREDRYE